MGNTVVVGGGASGLAAAYTLQEGGADCTVLEKRDFSGGRLFGTVKEGFTLDLGAQFLFSRYHTTFELAGKLGIMKDLVTFKPPVGILRNGKLSVISMDMKENLRQPIETLKAGRFLSPRGRTQMARFGLKLAFLSGKLDFDDPLKAIELDGISAADYARDNFGEEILEYIMQPVTATMTLGNPERVSAAYALGLAWYIAPGLSTFRKGIVFLAEELSKRIEGIRLNAEVKRVVLEDRKVKGVEVESGGKTDFIDADNVVCCTPAGNAAGILGGLPPEMTDILNSINYSAFAHVVFATRERLTGDLYALVTPRREGLRLSGILESAVKSPEYAPPGKGIIHAFTFGEYGREMLDLDDSAIRELVRSDIREVIPDFPDEEIFCEIFRWPQAVCLSSPGQITAVQHLKEALRSYEGLQLAGEYCGLPSVESAIHSGVKAARRILAS